MSLLRELTQSWHKESLNEKIKFDYELEDVKLI